MGGRISERGRRGGRECVSVLGCLMKVLRVLHILIYHYITKHIYYYNITIEAKYTLIHTYIYIFIYAICIYTIPRKNSKNNSSQDFRANFRVIFSRGVSLDVLYIFLQSGAYT